MSAFATLTLQNNAATNVVFNPQSIDSDGVATYLSGDAILDAKKKVTMSVSLPKGGSTVARVKQKVVVPIMDTIDANKKVAEAYVTIDFVLPKLASETIRLDLRKYADTLLTNAVTTAAVQSLEAIY
jgi:hypothetical protein